jgi:hypothetical protein
MQFSVWFEVRQSSARKVCDFLFFLEVALNKSFELQPVDGTDKYRHSLGTYIKDSVKNKIYGIGLTELGCHVPVIYAK